MRTRALARAFRVGALALALAPLLIAVSLITASMHGLVQSLIRQSLEKTSSFAVIHVTNILTVPSRLVAMTAEAIRGREDAGVEDAYTDFLGMLIDGYPAMKRFDIFGARATVEASYPPDPERIGFSVTGYSFYEEARGDGNAWSSVFLDHASGKPFVAISAPIGERVLVAYVDLSDLNQLVSASVRTEGASIAVLDASGIYIAHPDTERVARRDSARLVDAVATANAESVTIAPYADGSRRFICAALREPLSGWTVAVFLDEAEAYRPVRMIAMAWAAVLLATVIAASAFSRWMANRLVRPILRLGSIASAIGEGAYEQDGFRSGLAELDAIATALVSTGSKVAARELELRSAVGDRDVLVREIHHRVKNNLAVLVGLVCLAEEEAPESAKDTLSGLRRRVQAMSSVHELSYARGSYADVMVEPYLRMIIDSVSGNDNRCSIELECGPYSLPVDKAMPLGLIANELIVNAVKYAYGRSSGRVTVSVSVDDGAFWLTVCDDGVGIGAQDGGRPHRGTGLELVEGLASQLRGRFGIGTGPGGGTRAELSFPLAPT